MAKTSFEQLKDSLNESEDIIKGPSQYLEIIHDKLKSTMIQNFKNHCQNSKENSQNLFDGDSISDIMPIKMPQEDAFDNMKIVGASFNILNKKGIGEIPDISLISFGEDNQKTLNLYQSLNGRYKKYRELVFYVHSEHEKKATGEVDNLIVRNKRGFCEIYSMDLIFDIKKEIKNFTENVRRFDGEGKFVEIENADSLKGDQRMEIEEPIHEKNSFGEEKDSLLGDSDECTSEVDSLDKMLIE